MDFLSYGACRFHVARTMRSWPISFAAALGAFVLVVVIGLLCFQQSQQVDAMRQYLAGLRQVGPITRVLSGENRSSGPLPVDLPQFFSARFVDTLNEVATDAKFSLDEVSYELDDNISQPYLRYRAVLTLSASYPAIRQFVAHLSTRLQNVDLDAVNCTRGDIGKTALTCDLTFSAFFRKGSNG